MDICPKCGLPLQACVCDEIDKKEQRIKINKVKRRYGKITTLVEGVNTNTKEIAKNLKSELACGGTVKGGVIELQGDHTKKVKEALIRLGFDEESISE